MQIYKIDIDTNKPITQRIAVPQDCDKYGLVVSSTTNGHQTHNLSCTIMDGDNTLTPSKTLEDGSQLFIMSSIGNTSRNIKVAVSATPTKYEGMVVTTKVYAYKINLPAGMYYRDELNLFGFDSKPRPAGKFFANLYVHDAPASEVHSIYVSYNDPTQPDRFDLYPNAYFQNPLPADTPIISDGDFSLQAPFTKGTVVPDSYIGNNVNCAIDVQLDERRDATPDGDIQLDPAVYDDIQATSLSVENITLSGVGYTPTTINIGGTEYKVLAATANI